MARFHEVLDALMATEGLVVPEDFMGSLTGAYDEDFGASAAAVDAARTAEGAANEQIATLKIKLHDYMAREMASAAAGVENDDAASGDIDTDDEDGEPSFDDMFEKEEA